MFTLSRWIIVLAILLAIGCATAEESSVPITPSPTRSSPSDMDLMCDEAIDEMRRLIARGGRNITYYDPRGQLASLIETCIQSGKGG